MQSLIHLPLSVEVDRAAGICTIKQQVGSHVDEVVVIDITRDQAIQVANHLLAAFKVKANERIEGNEEGFDRFWSIYPVKEAKAVCLALWKQNGCTSKLEAILADVDRRKESKQWRDGFIPHPQTYLRQKRYDDSAEDQAPQPWVNAI